jgi:hypothetical protein
MSLLLLSVDPGTPRTQTAEPWIVGPSSNLLDLVERITLILELRYALLTENFKSKSLPTVGLELLNLGLLGRRLIH